MFVLGLLIKNLKMFHFDKTFLYDTKYLLNQQSCTLLHVAEGSLHRQESVLPASGYRSAVAERVCLPGLRLCCE